MKNLNKLCKPENVSIFCLFLSFFCVSASNCVMRDGCLSLALPFLMLIRNWKEVNGTLWFVLYSWQIGVLAFLNGGEEGKTLYNAFVAGQVCYEVYKRLTLSQTDVLRVRFLFKLVLLMCTLCSQEMIVKCNENQLVMWQQFDLIKCFISVYKRFVL